MSVNALHLSLVSEPSPCHCPLDQELRHSIHLDIPSVIVQEF
jgi:hypothetical protein